MFLFEPNTLPKFNKSQMAFVQSNSINITILQHSTDT